MKLIMSFSDSSIKLAQHFTRPQFLIFCSLGRCFVVTNLSVFLCRIKGFSIARIPALTQIHTHTQCICAFSQRYLSQMATKRMRFKVGRVTQTSTRSRSWSKTTPYSYSPQFDGPLSLGKITQCQRKERGGIC